MGSTWRTRWLLALVAGALQLVSCRIVTLTVPADDPTIIYSPASNSWIEFDAPGSYSNIAAFLVSNANQGVVKFTFPVASTTLQFFGYQRSDGGKYSLSIDGGATATIDVFNSTSTGNDPPILLFSKTGLTSAIHTVVITNLVDTRISPTFFGQMNVDHLVITGVPPKGVAPTFPVGSTLANVPMQSTYHVPLSLGAASTSNGGNGATVEVLVDAGASGAWVIWSGCTQPNCAGHSTYKPSTTHFTNFSISEGEFDLTTWRVNDTVSFGNKTIPSTPFGAAFMVPSSESLDGNFGIAKSYCNGVLCVSFINFVEAMWEAGVIKTPTISFYQLNSADNPASGVSSVAQVGGVDKHKFTGTMDWVPVNAASMWQVPWSTRYVTAAGKTTDQTASFHHPTLTFDTGDPGQLGLPTDDWQRLLSMIGATTTNGVVRFPCTATMTWNMHGSRGRNYTFPLSDSTTNSGGFCNPLANDAGPTTNWIMGIAFLTDFYLSFYFGNKGVGAVIGFGAKNLAASAATSAVLIGSG